MRRLVVLIWPRFVVRRHRRHPLDRPRALGRGRLDRWQDHHVDRPDPPGQPGGADRRRRARRTVVAATGCRAVGTTDGRCPPGRSGSSERVRSAGPTPTPRSVGCGPRGRPASVSPSNSSNDIGAVEVSSSGGWRPIASLAVAAIGTPARTTSNDSSSAASRRAITDVDEHPAERDRARVDGDVDEPGVLDEFLQPPHERVVPAHREQPAARSVVDQHGRGDTVDLLAAGCA